MNGMANFFDVGRIELIQLRKILRRTGVRPADLARKPMRLAGREGEVPEQLILTSVAHPSVGPWPNSARALLERRPANRHRAGWTPVRRKILRNWMSSIRLRRKICHAVILAVRGHDPASIIATLKRRLTHDEPLERNTALGQIGLIAGFR